MEQIDAHDGFIAETLIEIKSSQLESKRFFQLENLLQIAKYMGGLHELDPTTLPVHIGATRPDEHSGQYGDNSQQYVRGVYHGEWARQLDSSSQCGQRASWSVELRERGCVSSRAFCCFCLVWSALVCCCCCALDAVALCTLGPVVARLCQIQINKYLTNYITIKFWSVWRPRRQRQRQ